MTGEVALRLESELRREVSDRHSLSNRQAVAIARRSDTDDVLFLLDEDQVAEVHLTWSKENSAEFPWTTLCGRIQDWLKQRPQET